MAFVLPCVSTKGLTFLRAHLNKASRNLSQLPSLFSQSCRDTSDGPTRLARCPGEDYSGKDRFCGTGVCVSTPESDLQELLVKFMSRFNTFWLQAAGHIQHESQNQVLMSTGKTWTVELTLQVPYGLYTAFTKYLFTCTSNKLPCGMSKIIH